MRKRLKSDLLNDWSPRGDRADFQATINGHGLYNTFQFVLRLSPVVHQKIASMPSGIIKRGTIDLDGLKAFSTYLHETVHWWQHIGSTYGLMLSLTYPAQAHANHGHLKSLIASVGFKKSIRQLLESLPDGGFGTPGGEANIVVNNHFDMEVYRRLTRNPSIADDIIKSPLFESIGHSYKIAYGNILLLLSSVSDQDHKIIPHPNAWIESFRKLQEAKIEGFCHDSPVSIYPIGAYEVFEGQARMAQLQYLHFATGGHFGIEAAYDANMFDDVYGKAFSTFLELTELERPPSIDHPTIGMFLLICDLAINPGSAFPFPLRNFATFIRDIEPGTRFVWLCRLARLKCPEAFSSIRDYSRVEYASVSKALSDAIVEASPLEIAEEFCRWTNAAPFRSLMDEYEDFRFKDENFAVRVLFSHFLAFMRDKLDHPEFFCWPGVWLAADKVDKDTAILFDRHGALFVDKEHDDGIYARLAAGRSDVDVEDVLDNFYANNVLYDLTRQWITEPGPFRYDYRWLSQQGSAEEMQGFAERCFASLYGVNPSQVVVLSV